LGQLHLGIIIMTLWISTLLQARWEQQTKACTLISNYVIM